MENLVPFRQYMADFERTVEDDDWSRIRAHLTDDFVHERDVGPLMRFRDEGADAAIEAWRHDVENLDRQFDRRIFVPLGEARVEGDRVRLRWIFLGVLDDTPTFVDEGEEVARYRDGRMCELVGHYPDFSIDRMKRWLAAYGSRLPAIAAHATRDRGAAPRRP